MFRGIGFNQTGCPLYFNRTRHGCLEGNGREKLQSVKLEANFSIPKLSEILAVIKNSRQNCIKCLENRFFKHFVVDKLC